MGRDRAGEIEMRTRLALGLLRTGRALGRDGCCAGGGDALALAAGCGVGSTLKMAHFPILIQMRSLAFEDQ